MEVIVETAKRLGGMCWVNGKLWFFVNVTESYLGAHEEKRCSRLRQ